MANDRLRALEDVEKEIALVLQSAGLYSRALISIIVLLSSLVRINEALSFHSIHILYMCFRNYCAGAF